MVSTKEANLGMLALDSKGHYGVHFHPVTSELTCFSLRTLRVLARLSLSSETSRLATQPLILTDCQTSEPYAVLCLNPTLVRYFALPTLKTIRDLALAKVDPDHRIVSMRIDNFVGKNSDELSFFMVDKRRQLKHVSPSNTINFEGSLGDRLLFDFNATTLCTVDESNGVNFFDLQLDDVVSKLSFGPRHHFPGDRPLVLIRCHPQMSNVVALADTSGRILVCHEQNYGRIFHSILHWHSEPPRCLAFSLDGVDLVSGGSEAVLVKWNAEQGKPNVFAPRLGASVIDVQIQATSNHTFALLSDDAIIRLNDAFFVSGRNFVGSRLRTAHRASLFWHSATATIAFVNASGFVHFFSPHSHETAFILEIDDTNRVGGGDDKKIDGEVDQENISTLLTLAEDSGKWLASTSDGNIRLWHLALDQDCKFVMHSCILEPHTDTITALKFIEETKSSPSKACLLITSSKDKCLKVWQFVEDSDDDQSGSWQFLTTLNFRGKVAHCLDYSLDRSLLAAGFDSVVALFSLKTFALKSTLANRESNEPIESLAFNRERRDQNQLVTTSKKSVNIWNVLTSQLILCVEKDHCIVSPVGRNLVVVANSSTGNVQTIQQILNKDNEGVVVNIGEKVEEDADYDTWLSIVGDWDGNLYWSRGCHMEWGGRLDLSPVEEKLEDTKKSSKFPNLTSNPKVQEENLEHLREVRLRDIQLTRPLMNSLDRVLEQVL